MEKLTFSFLIFFSVTQMATAQTSFLNLGGAPTAEPETPAASAPSEASGRMVCTGGTRVTLTRIAANPELAANLKTFMNGVEFKDGEVYTRDLVGQRKDPGACAGFFGPIDLAGCQKYKPAGQSQFRVANGEVQYLADGRNELIPITLQKICSDGLKKMTFQFFYDQQFLTVHAGPWDYTITVFKQDGKAYSNINAIVKTDGTRVSLNRKPIAVGPVQITSNRGRSQRSADDFNGNSAETVR